LHTEEEATEEKIFIHSGSLYAPWNNIVKTGYAERHLAVVAAA